MNTKKNLEGKFNPKDFEETLYQRWEERGYFKPTMDKNKKDMTAYGYQEVTMQQYQQK